MILVVALLVSCSTQTKEEVQEVFSKGKPVNLCESYVNDLTPKAYQIAVGSLQNSVYGRYAPYDKGHKKFEIRITNLPCTQVYQDTYNFTNFIWRVNLKDSNGDVIDTYCFNARCNSTSFKLPKKFKDGTYTLEFIDFPEVVTDITFTKPDPQYGG